MKRKKGIVNNGSMLVEGQGAAYWHPPGAVEECAANPFSTPNPVRQIIETWLNSTGDRFSVGALYNLRRLRDYPKSEIKKVVRETWVGSDMELIKRGLVEIGVAKPKTEPLQESAPAPKREDTAAQLLREAVVHLPEFEQDLRYRIEAYLSGR